MKQLIRTITCDICGGHVDQPEEDVWMRESRGWINIRTVTTVGISYVVENIDICPDPNCLLKYAKQQLNQKKETP